MLNQISSALLLIVLIFVTGAKASQKADATAFLARLPSSVDQDVIILDGIVHSGKDVVHWDVIVNDAIATTVEPQDNSERVPIRLAITLRSGNNVVEIAAVFKNGRSQRWRTNILRRQPAEGRRYALLLIGQRGYSYDVSPLTSLRLALEQSGVSAGNIWTISRYDELKDRLATVAKKATNKDQFLVYFLGTSKLFGATGEPVLKIDSYSPSESDGILFSDLVRQVEGFDLPSLSLLIDTTSDDPATLQTPPSRSVPPISAFANAERMGAPWLRTASLQPVEIATSNVLNQPPGAAPGDFTRSFISSLNSPIINAGPCTALSDVIASMNRSLGDGQSSAIPRPLYFAQQPNEPSSSSFCFSHTDAQANSLVVSATAVQSQMRPHTAAVISAEIPRNLGVKWAELLVDGILLRHVYIATDASHENGFKDERIPISTGTHLIEVRGGATTSILASGKTQLAVPKEKGRDPSFLSGGTLNATILEPHELNSTTTDALVSLDFLVEDKDKGAVQFEVRNNGVVIYRGQSFRLHQGQKLEVVHRVLLSPGLNNIVVEVGRDGSYSHARTSIMRKARQSLRAVLIGPDSYESLPPTPIARADAELMKSFLLRYTELTPQQVIVLTGNAATRAAIVNSIASSVSTKPSDPFPYGNGGEDTLFLYFAGLGTTVADGRRALRCILPYDTDPARLADTCISTSEIDQLLDSWTRSIVVFDTSYDGLAGRQPPSVDAHELNSRTYNSYLATDPSWRLSAGIDRSNRVFVVGNVTNSASLEDDVTGHGVFTSAFVDSVKTQLSRPSPSQPPLFREVSLSDAYSRARNNIATITEKRQIPVIKGVLAHPFSFAEVSSAQLKERVSAISIRTERDVESLRVPDDVQLQRASELLNKVLAIDLSDVGAQYALAEIKLFQGDMDGAQELVDYAVTELSTTHDDPQSRYFALWLTLRAQLKLRAGDLDGAIKDCENSVHTSSTSLKSVYLLGELYAANLQYDKSLKLLNGLVDKFGTVTGMDNLSDEEWGRAIVWMYIGLRRADTRANPKARLQNYAAANPQSGLLFRVLLQNRLAKTIFRRSDRPDLTMNLDLQETWSHLVADYLLDPKHFEKDLRSFRERNLVFDPKDQKAFDCMVHFYVGMNAIFQGSNIIAKQEFLAVVDTAQTQYPEYWTAKGELSQLQ